MCSSGLYLRFLHSDGNHPVVLLPLQMGVGQALVQYAVYRLSVGLQFADHHPFYVRCVVDEGEARLFLHFP